ncbi:WXG100 family type VII secretion target [Nonomuraea zeae]|uniref:WXG100 family type VII secretion target n=1 Tax=Nonomuraea zeae TaxID=1642303 RepID=A0A5S4GSS9_9ACTN|nr:WXG100 family type VII secretion target [Nonomuraea zeae]TMR35987.1 WXG100 family type VII secretion target [Nonomuraea zeae]
MDFTEGKGLYMTAFTTASAAALVIRRPWANYVILTIGIMISDPGRMSSSADTWRTIDRGGMTSELDALGNELTTLKTTLADQWEGAAFEKFTEAYNEFTKSLDTLKSTRNNAGEAIDQSAKLYYWGARICGLIAGLMAAYATLLVAFRFSAPFVSQVVDFKLGKIAVEATRKVALKHGIALGVLAGLMYTAITQSEASGKAFPMMQAIPTEISALKSGAMPEFTNVGVDYDIPSGQLLPSQSDLTGGLG